jgi:adenine-specific DNA glycosylase
MGLSIVLKVESGQTLVALFQRKPQARFLKGSWGFFSVWSEEQIHGPDSEGGAMGIGFEKGGSFRHSITHHRLVVDVFIQNHRDFRQSDPLQWWHCDSLREALKWVPLDQVEPQLVANLDRKAWKVFQKRLTPGKLTSRKSRPLVLKPAPLVLNSPSEAS